MEIKINVGIRESVLMDAVQQQQRHPETKKKTNNWDSFSDFNEKYNTSCDTGGSTAINIDRRYIKCVQLLNCINIQSKKYKTHTHRERPVQKERTNRNENNHIQMRWAITTSIKIWAHLRERATERGRERWIFNGKHAVIIWYIYTENTIKTHVYLVQF